MTVHIRWSSTAQPTATPAALALPSDLAALLAQWRAAANKADFVAALPIGSAVALCNHIATAYPPPRVGARFDFEKRGANGEYHITIEEEQL